VEGGLQVQREADEGCDTRQSCMELRSRGYRLSQVIRNKSYLSYCIVKILRVVNWVGSDLFTFCAGSILKWTNEQVLIEISPTSSIYRYTAPHRAEYVEGFHDVSLNEKYRDARSPHSGSAAVVVVGH